MGLLHSQFLGGGVSWLSCEGQTSSAGGRPGWSVWSSGKEPESSSTCKAWPGRSSREPVLASAGVWSSGSPKPLHSHHHLC